jgi:hypothetical protein
VVAAAARPELLTERASDSASQRASERFFLIYFLPLALFFANFHQGSSVGCLLRFCSELPDRCV